jgi:hypothetical protein
MDRAQLGGIRLPFLTSAVHRFQPVVPKLKIRQTRKMNAPDERHRSRCMNKECCAYREAALAAGKKSQMTTVLVNRSLGETWHVSNIEHVNLRVKLPIIQKPPIR